MNGPYDDIIHLPHPISKTRPQMSIANRAAQFSPFAALTGYDAAIAETARRTDKRIELDDDAIAILNTKLRMLADAVMDHPEVSITYFRQDEKKEGGAYMRADGVLKAIDNFKRMLVLMNGEWIAIEDIQDITCVLFGELM